MIQGPCQFLGRVQKHYRLIQIGSLGGNKGLHLTLSCSSAFKALETCKSLRGVKRLRYLV